jgi:hypothetical protein
MSLPSRTTWCAAIAFAIAFVAACGGSSGGGTPTTPTPNTPTPQPQPQANRAPTITSAAVTPASGISTLTTHLFSSSANDPDGDALTYSWDFGNNTFSGQQGASVTYNNANTTVYRPVLTVRDSRGASASSTLSVTSATMAGTFTGTLFGSPISVTLTQFLGGLVTGTWQQASIGVSGEVGPTGEPGKVDANGAFELRFKVRVGSFTDFYYRGTMNPAGQMLTGTLTGSGFTGQVLTLSK